MKIIRLLLLSAFLAALTTSAMTPDDCTCSPAPATVADSTQAAPKRHPLKGVVVDVLADQSALLVKHEEIPGVMKAMTMLLKVDADTLKSSAAIEGAVITGQLVRKADDWWLEDIAVAPANG